MSSTPPRRRRGRAAAEAAFRGGIQPTTVTPSTAPCPAVDGLNLLEADFQAQVVSLAKWCGLVTYHNPDSRRSTGGFPDLVIIGSQRVLFRELKTRTGRVSPEQVWWIERLRAIGEDVDVWRPADMDRIKAELRAAGSLAATPPPPRRTRGKKRP